MVAVSACCKELLVELDPRRCRWRELQVASVSGMVFSANDPIQTFSAMAKRDFEWADRATEENKRLRSVVDETAEEFLCAITMALPVDPVMAMDLGKNESIFMVSESWIRTPSKGIPGGRKGRLPAQRRILSGVIVCVGRAQSVEST